MVPGPPDARIGSSSVMPTLVDATPCPVIAIRSAAGVTISLFLSQEVLQRRIVQHGVGRQPLQPRILVLQGLQPLGLRDLHAAELRFPFGPRYGSERTSTWTKPEGQRQDQPEALDPSTYGLRTKRAYTSSNFALLSTMPTIFSWLSRITSSPRLMTFIFARPASITKINESNVYAAARTSGNGATADRSTIT